jgi:hypothetical protein
MLRFFQRRWHSCTVCLPSSCHNRIIMISDSELSSLYWSWQVPWKEPILTWSKMVC